jgi:hypothetical protein
MLGTIAPVHGAAVAHDGRKTLAMLRRRPNESTASLLNRLDAAIATAQKTGTRVDEINDLARDERYAIGNPTLGSAVNTARRDGYPYLCESQRRCDERWLQRDSFYLNLQLLFLRSEELPRQVGHSTVTLFARFLGLSTSVPRATAVWYASNCSGTTCRIGDRSP